MNVVILDDNQMNVALLRHLVGRVDDCRTDCFNGAPEALAWCGANDADLVILDYMMPEMDGLEFIRRYRALPRGADTPLLMITADHQQSVRYQALQYGANDFANKPIDKIEFMARVRNMLALRRSHKLVAERAERLDEEVRQATAAILARERETIVRLARAAEYRDPETGAHILRMAHYSKHVARNLGLAPADQELILEAAPMHDIGKVGIHDAILLKPGKLDPQEFEIMQRHASIGYEILKDSPSPILRAAAVIAGAHHEKWDGSGYPAGLAGENIPLFGRIVAVADVFDALLSERPYKKAWPLERAVAHLEAGAGGHFEPACVAAFLEGWDDVLAIMARYRG